MKDPALESLLAALRQGSLPLAEVRSQAEHWVSTVVEPERGRAVSALIDLIQEHNEICHGSVSAGDDDPAYRRSTHASLVVRTAAKLVHALLGSASFLDSASALKALDRSGVMARLGAWPEHLRRMHREGERAAGEFLGVRGGPERAAGVRRVVFYGLGGSGAPQDLAREVLENFGALAIDVRVARVDTPHPDSVEPGTLAIFTSFSGNTEEVLHCYRALRQRTDLIAAMGLGGELRSLIQRDRHVFIQLPEEPSDPAWVAQPRESVCLQSAGSLSFLVHLGLPSGVGGPLDAELLAVERKAQLLSEWRARLEATVPARDNPAKQLASMMTFGTRGPPANLWDAPVPYVLADHNLKALAHEVVTQFRERSKLMAASDIAPEALHNTIEAVRACSESAAEGLGTDPYVYLILDSADAEPRIRTRLKRTLDLAMAKTRFAVLTAEGDDPYERALYLTYFNAHMTTYAAYLNGFDPLPVPTMSWLKRVMSNVGREQHDTWPSGSLLLAD